MSRFSRTHEAGLFRGCRRLQIANRKVQIHLLTRDVCGIKIVYRQQASSTLRFNSGWPWERRRGFQTPSQLQSLSLGSSAMLRSSFYSRVLTTTTTTTTGRHACCAEWKCIAVEEVVRRSLPVCSVCIRSEMLIVEVLLIDMVPLPTLPTRTMRRAMWSDPE